VTTTTNRWRAWLGPVAWLVATGLLVLLAMRVDFASAWQALHTANLAWCAAAVACYAAIQPLGALQWRALFPVGASLPYARVMRIWTVASIANNTTPSVVGHLTALAMMGAETTVGRMPALSIMVLDQVVVGLTKVAALATAAWVVPMPEWMAGGASVLGATVLATVVVVAIASLFHASIGAWASRVSATGVVGRVAPLVASWAKGLDALRSPGRFTAALALAATIRVAELAAILCVQTAFGLEVSLQTGILVLAATSLASFVAFVPANLGTYEAAVFAAYRLLGVDADIALGMALVQHACQLLPAVGIGYLVLTVERIRPVQRP